MIERLEQPIWSPQHAPVTEEQALAEADVLREKIRGGEAATYAEAEQLLARDKFQKTLERKAEGRDLLRPKWKKWLGISKTDPETIAQERASRENERISSLVASGKAKSVTEALEYLHLSESFSTGSPKEQDLTQRALSRTGELLGGQIGGATFVELKDDGSAVYKPHSEHREEKRIEFINKERAAYLIDRFLGFNFVPPTVVRKLNKGIGSLQEFIPDAKVGYEVQSDEISEEERMKLNLFDVLLLNSDRNPGNYLLKAKKIYAIDHGYTLPLQGLYSADYQYKLDENSTVPAELRIGLKRFAEWPEGEELLRDALAGLFGDKYAGAIMKRIHLFLVAIDEQGNFSKEQFCKGLQASKAELCPT